eukprot:15732548-Heterocapsa_arctica.AAC.1
MVLGVLAIPELLKMTKLWGRHVHTKMIELMVRHVERNSNNRYWNEDINKLTEGQSIDSGKEERHDTYRKQQKEERHDTKWKYRERVEGEGYRSTQVGAQRRFASTRSTGRQPRGV